MATRDECEAEIVRVSGGAINKAEAAALLRKFSDRIAASGGDPLEMARQIGDEATAAAIRRKQNRIMDLRKRMTRDGLMDRQYQGLKQRHPEQSLYLTLHVQLEGINTVIERGRASVAAWADTKSKEFIHLAAGGLEKLGTLQAFMYSEPFRDKVLLEVYEQSMANAGRPHHIGVTGDRHALASAEIINRAQSLSRSQLNAEGAWIGDYAGYISATTYDSFKMWKAGLAEWSRVMLENMDQARTFEGVEAGKEGEFLKSVYDNAYTGIHAKNDSLSATMKDPAFTGPENLAKSISQSRIIHFKDGQSWLNVQKQFGIDNPAMQIIHGLRNDGRYWALMKKFGTRPKAEFAQDIDRMALKYRHSDPIAAGYLQRNKDFLMREFGYADGENDLPVNRQWSRILQGARNISSAAKLTFVSLTHLFGMTTKIMQIHYGGEDWGRNIWDTYASFFRGVQGRGDRAVLHDLLRTNIDGRLTHLMQMWTPGSASNSGITDTMLGWTMKLNGFNYVIGSAKAGAEDTMASILGRQVGREFHELMPETQRGFIQYGISPLDWEMLRTAPDHFQMYDRTYLTPDAANRIPPQLNKEGDDLLTQKIRGDLAFKLHTYYDDYANSSIVTPGISEKARFYGADQPGTWAGEIRRAMFQFKMWGLANIRQNLGREIYGNPASGSPYTLSKSQTMGLVTITALTAILGYMRMASRAVLTGEMPPDPTDWRTAAAAILQGGGFGIFGDLLNAETARNEQNAYELAVGPVIGTGIQALRLPFEVAKAAAGDRRAERDIGPHATKLVVDNAPLINLYYTRMALNYLFLWRFQEWLNPGFLQRQERRNQLQNNKAYYFSPAQHAYDIWP